MTGFEHISAKQLKTDKRYMSLALRQARTALDCGEVPVGAVVVLNGKLISKAHNRTEQDHSQLSHAELLAISAACEKLGDWRLTGATIYVTLEPCSMCAGAIINSRIDRVVFGAYDPAAGSFGSIIDLSKVNRRSSPRLTGGVMADECLDLLRKFFSTLRG